MKSPRMNESSFTLALLFAAVVATPLAAQVRADPGTVINGRVAVRVYVVLADNDTPYEPVRGVQLRFFRTTADTAVVVRTDDAGAATALLLPGEYRLMSSSPVNWKGYRYAWNRLVQVRPGLATIELGAGAAERSEIVEESPLGPTDSAAQAQAAATAAALRKDPGMATLYSFFAPGAGHLYAQERVTGGLLLGLSVVGLAVTVNALSCATANDCESSTTGMTLGAAGALAFLGSWAYAMFDADDAVRRFNSTHGVLAASVRPVIASGTSGRTRLGFSVALPR